jgi:tetratricopeptide (TPR) repeat protein
MPFIKQTDRQAGRDPVEIGSIFTGRFNEQRFFVEHILTPEIPTAHVIWVWGPAGVGKSKLLTYLRDKASRLGLKDGWLTALVDERQGSPADLMERCAVQLRLAGAPLVTFEQTLSRYKQTTHHPQPEQVVAQAAFIREVSDLTKAKVMDESVLGGLYETVVRKANASFGYQQPASQMVGESRPLNDTLDGLTQAFVSDLNWLTTTKAPFHPRQIKRGHRVILFFDMFDPSTVETVDWLLHHMLPAMNNDRVVLVVAGRKPIELTQPDEQMVYLMPIAPFTERETRTYLARCGIIDKDRVASIWQLSGGLPLSVSMLACDPEGPLDEKAGVVTNVLQQLEGLDRRMSGPVLQAALCSRSFTQDDLSAFPTLTEQERIDFYRWLIDLPCVQLSVLDGRHHFHPLAQRWFIHAFSRSAPQEEQAARQGLAHYYQQQLEQHQLAGGRSASFSIEWLELALARAFQLFFLMDNASHASAIEQMMEISSEEKQDGELVTALHALLEELPDTLETTSARRAAQLLLRYIEADLASEELLAAATGLIDEVSHTPTFSATLLARIYNKRGMAYYSRSDYRQAMEDFDQALGLDSAYTGAYLLRGMTYSARKEYQQAIVDFDQALVLDAGTTFAYAHRGIALLQCEDYERAIADFDRALALDPQLEGALLLRRLASWEILAYRPGKGEVDQAIKLDPNDAQAYVQRGMASSFLSEELQAIVDFDRALELDPSDALAYAGRGYVYLEMGEIKRARVDLLSSQAFAPNDVYVGLLLVWLDLSQQESLPEEPGFPERLEELAARDQHQPAALASRGVSLLLRGRLEEAEATLDRALLIHPAMREAFFWKSMIYALLQRDEEARAALVQALEGELPLSRVLLAPLRWLEQKRPDFYRNYAEPVMARSDERSEQ